MNFLKSALSSVIEIDDKSESSPTAAAPAVVKAPVALFTSTIANQDMVDSITKSCMSSRTDYTEFLQAADKLAAIIPDEATRFKAAMATISGGSRTAQSVIAAIDSHVALIQSQVDDFNRSCESHRGTDVKTIRDQAETTKSSNTQIADQIKQLNAQIAQLNQQMTQNEANATALAKQAEESEAKINGIEAAFSAAADVVRKTLNDRKALLQRIAI